MGTPKAVHFNGSTYLHNSGLPAVADSPYFFVSYWYRSTTTQPVFDVQQSVFSYPTVVGASINGQNLNDPWVVNTPTSRVTSPS